VKNAKNDSGLCLLSALPAKTGQTLNRLPTQDFSALAGYMSTFRNRNLEKISLVSTFEKIYSAKMWLMSTFENENLKIIFSCLLFLTGTTEQKKSEKCDFWNWLYTEKRANHSLKSRKNVLY